VLAPTIPFFDREREVGDLRASLDAALGGSGRVVLVGGEPGIGKTRLASVITGKAGARGVPVWWGRACEDGSAPAFWPWNMALRRWIDQVGHEAVAQAAGSWGAELAHVFPVLRERMPDLPASEGWQSAGARFRLFDVVSRFLATVAEPAGLVVVLDDAHWADNSSLKLLEFIAADLADTRILVLVTYRDTEVQHGDPFSSTLSRIAREPAARRLVLSGLSPAHCARWITLTGVQGDTTTLGEALHRETNGNPFFVGEVVHLLAGEDNLEAGFDVQRVPQGVREVVGHRLDRLGDDCRTALAVAALFGDTIEAGTLAHLLGDVPLADHLDCAVRDRILVKTDGAPGQYGFAHGLIRRVLVDELQPSTRAAWHARIASLLESEATASEVEATELVRHLAAAGTPEALRKAFDYSCRGAEQAARGLGWEEAVRLYGIALDIGRGSGLLDSKRALELRLALAQALRGAGDVPAARARCDEVMAACRGTADHGAFARAALIYAGPIPEFGRVEPPVRAALEEACGVGPALDDALRARLYARLAGDLVAANEVEQSERIFALCDAAAAAARHAGAPGALAIALLGAFTARMMDMRPETAGATVPNSQEALAAAEASGEHEYAAATRYWRAMSLFASGESEAFASEVDGIVNASAASRVPQALWLADTLGAFRATVQGRFAEARDTMERALATGHRAQLPNTLGMYGYQRIMWHLLQGRLAEIAAELGAFVEGHPMGAGWRPLRALARLASGEAVAARVEFQMLLANGYPPAERGVMARTYLVGMAALCVALRDREHAPMLYDWVSRRQEVWMIGGGTTLGPWALMLGALARLCGRPADAVRHFETAIQLARQMGSPPIVARAQSLLASLRLSLQPDAEERERIAEMLAEAAHSAKELGLADVAARVERLQTKVAHEQVQPADNTFRLDGEVWAVRYAGRDLRLRDGKGPRYLATLLAAPTREVHVLAFGATSSSPSPWAGHEGLSVGLPGGCIDDGPDQRARREYRARLDDLRTELEEAERFADNGRAERLRAELEELVAELAGCFGTRPTLRGPAETARKAVTKVLRTQIGKLLDLHPALGRHLRDTVRTGKVCVYAPPTPVPWEVGFGPG
jgi:hypothetical protein